MKKNLLLVFLLVVSSSLRAQLIVNDVMMNTRTTLNQLTNAATWGEQLINLQRQAGILTTTLKYVTDVSSAVRDAAYARTLIDRQALIIDNCKNTITRARKVDPHLVRSVSTNMNALLTTNNSLVTLISSTLTSRFKMNDSERLSMLMAIKEEQNKILAELRATDMMINTVENTKQIIDLELFK